MTNRKNSKDRWKTRVHCIIAALIQLRWTCGETQQEVADALGWLRISLGQLESGRLGLRVADLFTLCDHYHVDPLRVMNVAGAIFDESASSQSVSAVTPFVLAKTCRSGFGNLNLS